MRERELEELGREREMVHGQLDGERWLLDADAREEFLYQRLAADETGVRSSGGQLQLPRRLWVSKVAQSTLTNLPVCPSWGTPASTF